MEEIKSIICQCTNLASAIYFDIDIEKEVNNLQQKLFSDEVQLGSKINKGCRIEYSRNWGIQDFPGVLLSK